MKKLTNQEIITKAVEKAIKNGFYSDSRVEVVTHPLYTEIVKQVRLYSDTFTPNPFVFHPLEIIFSAPFAKAFWGKKKWGLLIDFDDSGKFDQSNIVDVLRYEVDDGFQELEEWQYRLQEMIVEEDAIKYLEKFL